VSSTQIMSIAIISITGLLGGAAATALITAISRRRLTDAEADSLVVESAEKLLLNQQRQIDRGELERIRMETEIASLRSELALVRKQLLDKEIRYESEIRDLRSEVTRLALLIPGGTQ